MWNLAAQEAWMVVSKLETPDDIKYGFKSILDLKSYDMDL